MWHQSTEQKRRGCGSGMVFVAALVLIAGCAETSEHPANLNANEPSERAPSAPWAQRADPDTIPAETLSLAFRAAANRVLPAVAYVQIERTRVRQPTPLPIPEPFREFFGLPEGEFEAPPERGTGTGFLFDDSGHVMTNNHVVRDADRILVRLADGREYEAVLVGGDNATDVAVLKVDAEAEFLPDDFLGDSDALQVGDWVLALGNPLGLDFTVTAGIVSAKGRRLTPQPSALEAFIQTDAAINPGNSGGPLIDVRGRVVGINSAIFGAQRFVGYGFAVPINLARRVASDLIEYGEVRRPRLGVTVSDVTAVDAEAYGLDAIRGAEINTVEDGSPAQEAGIQVGDVVLALDGDSIQDATALTTGLAVKDPGDQVTLTVFRDGRTQEIDVTLGRFQPEDPERDRPMPEEEPNEETWLGFRVSPLTPQLARRYSYDREGGVIVSEVARFGAAAQAGVRPGQLILAIGREPVETVEDVRSLAAVMESGSVVSLRVKDPEIGETIINFRAWR